MVQKKPFPRVSSGNRMAITPKTAFSRRKRSETDDKHWEFLDEIEAPLWVDLTLECESGYNDKDDEWFHVIHPFHECSSRQLIAKFGHSAEDHVNLELDIQEKSSPRIPLSVSKSRGKDYRRNGVQGNQMVMFNDQHPVKTLNQKSSFLSSNSNRMTGSKSSNGRRKEVAGSSSGSRVESNLSEMAGPCDIRKVPPLCDQKFTSNSNVSEKGESSSSSTITSEGNGPQHQNSLEVSSHSFGQTRGFLSALKVSLRKSCVTRQASRVEIANGRLSEGQKSSSGKTSVGSSTNLGDGRRIWAARHSKDMTPPDSKNLGTSVACKQNLHEAKLPKAPDLQPHCTISNPKLRSQSFKSLPINQETSKVKQQKLHANVLVPHSVNKHYPPTATVKVKEKVVASSCGQIPRGRKENLAAKVAPRQKLSMRNTMHVPRVTPRVPEKSVRTTSIVPMVKERINDRSKVKKTGTMPEKVYFR